MHVLVLGQSNVANHGAERGLSDFGWIFMPFPMMPGLAEPDIRSRFLPLRDPIPTASGDGGSVWPRFAARVRARGLCRQLVITNLAMSERAVGDWSPEGKAWARLAVSLPLLRDCPFPVSHVVYHQGERDTFLGTAEEAYARDFEALYRWVRAELGAVPWVLCRASYREGVTSEAVRAAQNRMIDHLEGVYAGPDTDSLESAYRHDDTHFSEAGLERFAEMLVESFSALPPSDAAGSNGG